MGKEMSFAPAELYVLAGAAGVTDIFGLPNRDAIILLDAECVTKATTSLKEKGLLTSENGITPAAFQIIELLKEYENCHEYTRMNNVLIGFLKEDKDRVAVLTEIEPNKNNLQQELDALQNSISEIEKNIAQFTENKEKPQKKISD
ncbi:MAG TPA: hypothetical protein DG757_09525 [Bacillus sp. (in: Bacteria)]|nr:hypothetical protein [Bacillus sp. (in: firmicutes)]